ncbi:flagellar basal-body rod protein FlgG [Marinobacterium stanieri]|uniref:Flagellar basal-body rod protein FlgG n=1 Tax=Marinobacterium stanieri TaxID=49186 RepID=A0A1N6X2S4_9GAMM|nr:flagellar basal-body rod protein FlgG [Marinobacterium stanieri]SIQ96613.1 flagellar basal-body rod protein FlgG [Marinobacterium stanieri]
MHGALHVAKTGLSAQDTQLKVISNNLANVSTVGFKKDRLEFEDLLYQVRRQPGAETGADSQLPSGLQVGSGVRTVGTQKLFFTGDMQITDQPFDLAINGRGFLQVQMPNGEIGYTRNGELHLDSENRLVTAEGYPIEPEITLPGEVTNFSVGGDGTVSVSVAGDPEPTVLGQLETADFVNPQGLLAIGQNLFTETGASGAPIIGVPGEDGRGIMKQGMLEGSNVNAVEELVDMITTQRAYEMNSKVISTADEMLGYVSQQL